MSDELNPIKTDVALIKNDLKNIERFFDKIDDTHDGFISFVEFRDWLGGSKRRTNGNYTAGKFCVYFHVYISGIQCFETFQTILFSHKLQTLFNFLK